MRALTLQPEYWLVLAGLIRAKQVSSSSETMGGPGEEEEQREIHVLHRNISFTQAFLQRWRHVIESRLLPDLLRQIHHRLLPRCSSCLTEVSGYFCTTGPKVWSQFVSWGSQGAGVRPDHFLFFGRMR